MKVLADAIQPRLLRSGLSLALAIGALSVLGARAHADPLDPITVTPPSVKIIGRDPATGAPIKKITVEAHIAADAATLKNESGVVLLNDRVSEAAREACAAADPTTPADEGGCVRQAVKAATPNADAAITQARSTSVPR
jgi:UrcA family protein